MHALCSDCPQRDQRMNSGFPPASYGCVRRDRHSNGRRRELPMSAQMGAESGAVSNLGRSIFSMIARSKLACAQNASRCPLVYRQAYTSTLPLFTLNNKPMIVHQPA